MRPMFGVLPVSYDAGRMDHQFVQPGDAVPLGFRQARHHASKAFSKRDIRSNGHSNRRLGRAAKARRSLKLRRLLPFAIALVAALVFATMTEGGRSAREAAPLVSYLGTVLERVGLGLNEVTVSGQRMTRDSEIYDRLQLTVSRSIWLLDTKAARKRLETLPWVLKASLKRVFPDRLHIVIEERTPHALWSDGRKSALLDVTGRVLGAPSGKIGKNLPNIFGAGAPPHVDEILTLVKRLPVLSDQVGVYEWTANRRWTLHLKSGQQVLLPASGKSLALIQLTKGRPGQRLIDSNFQKLDLRIASQAAIEFRE
jgi:cell division protein FtsQ